MENSLKNSASEGNCSLELQDRLESMKKLLKRKERSLSRFNRAVKAKDHVRNSVLRKNFENSVNANGTECKSDSIINEDSFVKDSKLKSPSILKESISNNKDKHLSRSSVTDVSKYLSKDKSNCSSNDNISSISSYEETLKESNIDSNVTQNESNCGLNITRLAINNNSDNQSSINLGNDMKMTASNSTTPVLLRKRGTADSFKKRHVKRLFHKSNNNDYSEENNSSKPSCVSNKCETTQNICSSNLENKEQVLLVKDSRKSESKDVLSEFNPEKFLGTNLPFENKAHKKPIIIIKDKLCVSSKEEIISSCLSLPQDNSPFVLMLCKGKFSIWSFKDVDKSEENLLWDKFHDEQNELLQDIEIRKLRMFGGGCVDIVYFFIIMSPAAVGLPFEVISISCRDQEGVKLIHKSLSALGCPDCTFNGYDLEPWSFFFSVDKCKNSACPNFSSSCGTFTVVTFDVKYSLKSKHWELELRERQRVCDDSFRSVLLLHNYDCCFDSSGKEIMLCHSSSGILSLSTSEFSFPIVGQDSCCELRNELSSAGIIYAAAVKEILFLILKCEKFVKFLAVDPLSSVFDTLYKIKLRDMDMTSENFSSAIFYENKFFIISSDAEVRCLVL